jgi:hypothetical protein
MEDNGMSMSETPDVLTEDIEMGMSKTPGGLTEDIETNGHAKDTGWAYGRH